MAVVSGLVQRGKALTQALDSDIEFPALNVALVVDKQNAHYIGPIAVSWVHEPYSQGSYSNIGVGQFDALSVEVEEYGESVKSIFRSVDNRIFFAGEHTALENPSTMEGAVESGERVARIVRRALL
jgi:monoamine oxidase